MTNTFIQNQKSDPNWPNDKLTMIWARILKNEQTDDVMAELELNEDLRKFQLQKKEDPKDLLAGMSALKVNFGILIADNKKVAGVSRSG